MNQRILLLLLLFAGFLCSCEKNTDIPEPPMPEPIPEQGNRTVLAYIAADNSLATFALDDLKEMIEGMQAVDTKKNSMLVYIDRYESGKRSLSPNLIRICRNSKDEIILDTLKTYDANRNSTGADEMRDVCSYAFGKFPANRYGFILWSHGDGWIPYNSIVNSRWIGQDTDAGTKDRRMNIDELHNALKGLPYHLDYLFFDACFMQSIEVAYELRDCADYFIGSPTEIPGPGAPYQKVVPSLFAETDAPLKIAASYFDFYNGIYNDGVGISNKNWTGGVSIAVLASDKLDPLANMTKRVPLYTSGNVPVSGIKCYDPYRDRNYYDMNALIKSLTESDSDLYQSWKTVYDEAVVYAKTTTKNYNTSGYAGYMVSMEGFTGVSTYILANKSNAYYKTLSWYSATGGK